jgi:D-inositol-3-phosphate glycosyltransferase
MELAQRCQRILAATEKEKEHLVRYYGTPASKIGVVPCGVNLDRFRPMDKKTARSQVGFAEDESIVLYVGRLSPIKGTDRLLEAMGGFGVRKPIRLVIIGGDDYDTPELESLQRLSRELGLANAVEFMGRVKHEKLTPYYCAADVLVLPSRYETFGLVALEALASGTPVVATPVGAMKTIIREGETGHVTANGASRLLAAGIEKFIEKSSSGVLSAAAIRATVLRFGWGNVAPAIVDEYSTLLRLHRRSYSASPRIPETLESSFRELDSNDTGICISGLPT